MPEVWVALGLTGLAGLATGIGSVIAFMATRTNYRFLSVATGFSAGVMLYVSFVEILPLGAESLVARFGHYGGHWANAASFFAGMVLIALIDYLVPAAENPHETPSESQTRPLHDPDALPGSHRHDAIANRKLLRMGLFVALAIGIHNFPEGLATFLVALQDPSLGVAIAVAIALHNIPEGISVSVPIFYATGRRGTAFCYSVLSGLAEPVGALIAYGAMRFVVSGPRGVLPPELMGVLFGAVAGIMVYISLDELLPTSRAYSRGHDSQYGLVAGMLVMALSLLLMQ